MYHIVCYITYTLHIIEGNNFENFVSSSSSPVSRQSRCSKHRWLWQFMKELLLVGDPALQVFWINWTKWSHFEIGEI